jgi:hypothetical protein
MADNIKVGYINQPEKKYKGKTYRPRRVYGIWPLLEVLSKVPEAIVYSSWRSLEEQKKLVAQGKSKTLNSNHRRMSAVDVINWKEVQTKMNKLGLINDISWDKNHFAFDGETKAAKYPIYDTLPKMLEEYKTKKAPVSEVKPEMTSMPTSVPITPVIAKTEPIKEKEDYLKPAKQLKQATEDIIYNFNTMLKGKKTYLGIAVLALGALGFGDVISEGELASAIDTIFKIVGIAVAVYGRYKAK